MERKLGLYVTLGDDGSLKRTLVSISGETNLEATTLNDEVILFSELIFDFYAFIVDRIRLSAAYLVTQDGDGKDTVDMRVFEFIQDTVQDLIEEFEEDDPLYGTLTRTIMEDRIPAADGSDTYPVTAVEKIISELSTVMLTQFSVNNILRDMRFHVPVDLDKKYRSLQEVEFTQVSSFSNLHTPEYLFRSAADYYTFLVLHFIAAEPRVALCECCGRYFIPKTAKKTLYCDRMLKDDKTCKDLGPALKHMIMRTNLYVEDGRVKSQLEHSSKRTLPINLMKLEPTNPEDSCFVFYEQENPDQIICIVAYTEKREKPELFYETEKMFRGKGYMTQAMKQVLDWMIQNECTGTLWLLINIQNIPSQKIAKHYGFVLSGEQVNSDQQWYCLNLAEIKENNHG